MPKKLDSTQASHNDPNTNAKPPPVKVFGIEFAPDLLRMPWKRRMETCSVVAWFLIFIGWPAVSFQVLIFLFVILPYPLWFPVVTFVSAYLLWIWLVDWDSCYTGSRTSSSVRQWSLWQHFNDYFPVKLVKTAELDPSRNYLFCSHPHGLLCTGVFSCFATEGNSANVRKLFPGIRNYNILTFNASFVFPFTRELVLKLGLCSADRKSMNYLLSRPGGGNVSILIPGGAPEALDFCTGTYILQLKKRKGFIKVALQNGSPLVPVFSFGENTVLHQIPNPPGSLLRRLQDLFQRLLMVPPVLFYGRGIFQYTLGFLPMRKPITVVVGSPIDVKQINAPSQQEIDELHEKYVTALTELFETYKEEYSLSPTDTLVIK